MFKNLIILIILFSSQASFANKFIAQVPAINTATILQQAYIKASNTGSGDRFGFSIALSGNTLVVGASSEDSNSTGINNDEDNNLAFSSGAVYVFVFENSQWSQQAYLKASNAQFGDQFGVSVDISGNTIVVGARFEDSATVGVGGDEGDNSALNSGAAYVFNRMGTVWSQQAYLKASNSQVSDMFGTAVGISNDTIVVGAINEDSNATLINGDQDNLFASQSGAVYVFNRDVSDNWSQLAYVKASNTDSNDQFGFPVAIDDDTLVVGANFESSNQTGVNASGTDNSAVNAGAAYVYSRVGDTWSFDAYLKASNTDAGDEFGLSVGVLGNQIVVGAYLEDSDAIGVNGDQLNNNAVFSGAGYLFKNDGAQWQQESYLKAFNTDSSDLFGYDVAISGGITVIGAQGEAGSATGINGTNLNISYNRYKIGVFIIYFNNLG